MVTNVRVPSIAGKLSIEKSADTGTPGSDAEDQHGAAVSKTQFAALRLGRRASISFDHSPMKAPFQSRPFLGKAVRVRKPGINVDHEMNFDL